MSGWFRNEAELPFRVTSAIKTKQRAKLMELRREGKTFREISEVLGVSESSACSMAKRVKEGRGGKFVPSTRSRFGQQRKGKGKIKEADVILIKRRLAIGETARKIAKDFGVTEASVYAIRTGRNWGWVAP